MSQDKKLFWTGTMRTGGSLLINILCLTENYHIFNERFNFFRFVFGKYDLNSAKEVETMLHHQKIRLKFRSGIEFEIQEVFEKILNRGLGDAVVYDEVMKYFLKPTGKHIWGEYANLSWRYIPSFLKMFPNGKVIYIMRDLRAVLSSFKKLTFLSDNLYLNVIFNWIDGVNHALKFQQSIGKDKFLIIRLEDLHSNPKNFVKKITDFTEEKFEKVMLEPEKWKEKLDERFVKINISSHTNEKVFGFNPERSYKWKEDLDAWIIQICEFLAGSHLNDLGYKLNQVNLNKDLLRYGLKLIARNDILFSNFQKLLITNEGVDTYPIDPAKPENWSSRENKFKKFYETDSYVEYINEINEIENKINLKYNNH